MALLQPLLHQHCVARPRGGAAHHYYVYYEPCADLVIALNPIEKRVVPCADYRDWDTLGSRARSAIERAEHLLQHDRSADALLLCIDNACELLRLMKADRP